MKEFVISLVGNPNTGKTTIFNALTGQNQKVGNWPGVTVEKKEGIMLKNETEAIKIVDLPGIYSLKTTSEDEIIASDFIIKNNPDLTIVLLDASKLERSLFLYMQLKEMGQKTVAVLNMSDLANSSGITIDNKEFSKLLGCPVIDTIANSNVNIDKLKATIIETLTKEQKIVSTRFRLSVKEALENIEKKLPNTELSKSSLAIKIAERDNYYSKDYALNKEISEILEKESVGGDLREKIIEDRWNFISSLCVQVMKKEKEKTSANIFTEKIDKIILNKYFGMPIFFIVIFVMFFLVYTMGDPIVGFIEDTLGIMAEKVGEFLTGHNTPALLVSFVVDGIFGGVGGVLPFFPNIFILFFLLGILEDSGYLSRGSFMIDKFMYMIGLNGKSFVPAIMGFGCSVPAMIGTRVLYSKKDKLLTMLVIPFISCSARLPVFVLFAGALFEKNAAFVIFSLYLLGIIVAIAVAKVLSVTVFKDNPSMLVMELPAYHVPVFKTILKSAWRNTKQFLVRAGTFIMLTMFVIWLFSSMPFGVEYASKDSYIGIAGSAIAPLFAWAGYGFWQAGIALISGFLAKEVIIGTLGTLLSGGEEALAGSLGQFFTPLSAYAYLVMVLLYTPCLTAVATFKQESNSWKWTAFFVGYTLVLGWIFSVIVYQMGLLLV